MHADVDGHRGTGQAGAPSGRDGRKACRGPAGRAAHVSVKAKTNEGDGWIGAGKIAVMAVATLEEPSGPTAQRGPGGLLTDLIAFLRDPPACPLYGLITALAATKTSLPRSRGCRGGLARFSPARRS